MSSFVEVLWYRASHHRVDLEGSVLLSLGVRSDDIFVDAISHNVCRVSPFIEILPVLLLCLGAPLSRHGACVATTLYRARGAIYASVIVIHRVSVRSASV